MQAQGARSRLTVPAWQFRAYGTAAALGRAVDLGS